jgi:hypothetical protein
MKKLILIQFAVLLSETAIMAQTEALEKKERLVNYTSRYSAGLLGGDNFSYSFLTNHGISISKHFETTVVLGLENYFYHKYVPILVDFHYNILKGNTTPYLKIVGGYMLDIERNGRPIKDFPGYTVGGGIGVRTNLTDKLSLFTEVGYRYVRLEREQFYYWWEPWPAPVLETHINRIELRVGISIK